MKTNGICLILCVVSKLSGIGATPIEKDEVSELLKTSDGEYGSIYGAGIYQNGNRYHLAEKAESTLQRGANVYGAEIEQKSNRYGSSKGSVYGAVINQGSNEYYSDQSGQQIIGAVIEQINNTYGEPSPQSDEDRHESDDVETPKDSIEKSIRENEKENCEDDVNVGTSSALVDEVSLLKPSGTEAKIESSQKEATFKDESGMNSLQSGTDSGSLSEQSTSVNTFTGSKLENDQGKLSTESKLSSEQDNSTHLPTSAKVQDGLKLWSSQATDTGRHNSQTKTESESYLSQNTPLTPSDRSTIDNGQYQLTSKIADMSKENSSQVETQSSSSTQQNTLIESSINPKKQDEEKSSSSLDVTNSGPNYPQPGTQSGGYPQQNSPINPANYPVFYNGQGQWTSQTSSPSGMNYPQVGSQPWSYPLQYTPFNPSYFYNEQGQFNPQTTSSSRINYSQTGPLSGVHPQQNPLFTPASTPGFYNRQGQWVSQTTPASTPGFYNRQGQWVSQTTSTSGKHSSFFENQSRFYPQQNFPAYPSTNQHQNGQTLWSSQVNGMADSNVPSDVIGTGPNRPQPTFSGFHSSPDSSTWQTKKILDRHLTQYGASSELNKQKFMNDNFSYASQGYTTQKPAEYSPYPTKESGTSASLAEASMKLNEQQSNTQSNTWGAQKSLQSSSSNLNMMTPYQGSPPSSLASNGQGYSDIPTAGGYLSICRPNGSQWQCWIQQDQFLQLPVSNQ